MAKLTKDFCNNKILLFYPQTEAEAAFVQQNLLDMGFTWGERGASKSTAFLRESVRDGLTLKENGLLYYAPSELTRAKGMICTSAEFDPPFDRCILEHQSERELIMTLFNKISALSDEVAAIKSEIMPKHLSKDGFKPK
jgi:hypothetical protein